MERMEGRLGDYIGIGMAATMLGRSPEQTGKVYEIINDHDLTVHKIGGTSLLSCSEFLKASGLKAEPPWNKNLAKLEMRNIYSRLELAEMLGVSVGTIHYMANKGEIGRIDLSEWNMSSLYYYVDDKPVTLPIIINAWGYCVEIYKEKDLLKVEFLTENFEDLEAGCWAPEPKKAWFMDGKTPLIEIEVKGKG